MKINCKKDRSFACEKMKKAKNRQCVFFFRFLYKTLHVDIKVLIIFNVYAMPFAIITCTSMDIKGRTPINFRFECCLIACHCLSGHVIICTQRYTKTIHDWTYNYNYGAEYKHILGLSVYED